MDEVGLGETQVFQRELKLLLVPLQELSSIWPTAVELLKQDAAGWEYMSFADIYVEICNERFQLWLFSDQNGAFACMVTELRHYPRALVMNIIHASALPSKDALELLTFHEMIEQWALKQGATGAQIPCGRRGWEKVLDEFGYEFAGIVLKKKLEPVKEH